MFISLSSFMLIKRDKRNNNNLIYSAHLGLNCTEIITTLKYHMIKKIKIFLLKPDYKSGGKRIYSVIERMLSKITLYWIYQNQDNELNKRSRKKCKNQCIVIITKLYTRC